MPKEKPFRQDHDLLQDLDVVGGLQAQNLYPLPKFALGVQFPDIPVRIGSVHVVIGELSEKLLLELALVQIGPLRLFGR